MMGCSTVTLRNATTGRLEGGIFRKMNGWKYVFALATLAITVGSIVYALGGRMSNAESGIQRNKEKNTEQDVAIQHNRDTAQKACTGVARGEERDVSMSGQLERMERKQDQMDRKIDRLLARGG